jgi:ribonucleases P/MRP protein subunit RPP40
MLLKHPYVIVISLDFSKAFYTVRHSTLLEKLAKLDIPDHVYTWFTDFFTGHAHLIRYNGQMSMLKSITASIIQGSAIRPASYVVNAGDLKASTPGNEMCKFADDTYLIGQ